MLLPGALLDAPLSRRALWWLMLSTLLPLLLNMLLLGLLLLSTLLLVMLVLPLLLLCALCLLLLLGWLSFLLSMLRVGLGLLFAVLLLLCEGRSSDSKKQRQDGCAGDPNYFHNATSITAQYVRLLYCKRPVVALTGLPMASPDTRSSTLRFCCRPAELPLEATGKVLPKPLALTAFAATPCCTR
jgi:hypothetical protein